MKILFLEWKSYCVPDMTEALEAAGHSVTTITFHEMTDRYSTEFESLFNSYIDKASYDAVFTFNYFPIVSKYRNKLNVLYISWVYDNPLVSLYSYTVINPCNRIFLFDRKSYEYFHNSGISTIFYLPLCANPNRLCANIYPDTPIHDVSFVGSLYTEPKQRLYDKIANVDEYSRGYLYALVKAQANIDGYFFLQDALTPELIAAMEKVCPVPANPDGVETPAYVYSHYFLGRQSTAIARQNILQKLSEHFNVTVYTHENCKSYLPNVIYGGKVDYYNGMPAIFQNSRINLNITLKTIQTGIPLRAWDILGCGGFLLSNYQEELCDYFVPGEDFIYYESAEDAIEKTAYFLNHENERIEIAQNAIKKIAAHHTFHNRVEEMFKML